MEITVFGRKIRIFTAEQINKLKELIYITIGSNGWYRLAVLCFCSYILICIICRIRRSRGQGIVKLMNLGIALYVVFLLSALVFSRPTGERAIITWNKSFFMTEHTFHETTLVMIVIKLCMIVPFGIAIKKTYYKAPIAVLIAVAVWTGTIIECMKYSLGRGSAAIGSAVLLTAGTLLGMFGESVLIELRKYRGKG